MTTGTLDILNVGAGHLEVRFDETNAVDLDQAKRMITQCLERGYAIFVEGKNPGVLHRVRSFDAKRGMYYITDVPGENDDEVAAETVEPEAHGARSLATAQTVQAAAAPTPRCPRCGNAKHKGRCLKPVPMTNAKATAIGRTAGG